VSDRIAQAVAEMRREAEGVLVLARVVEEIGEQDGWEFASGWNGEGWHAGWIETHPPGVRPLALDLDALGDIHLAGVVALTPSETHYQRTQALFALRDRVADAAVRARREVAGMDELARKWRELRQAYDITQFAIEMHADFCKARGW